MTWDGSGNGEGWETHNIGEKFSNDLYFTLIEAVDRVWDIDKIDVQWVKDFVESNWDCFNPDVDVDRDDLRLVDWDELVEHAQEEWRELNDNPEEEEVA